MCGIIGYIGSQNATPILLEGLKNLEYRGYDSSGIGLFNDKGSKIMVQKAQGKIRALEDKIKSTKAVTGTLGISHTRWATHGAPSQKNAHPHCSPDGRIAVVHNGIIENYGSIKKTLQEKGYTFVSDTDTEVIVHLIHAYYKKNLTEAVTKAIQQLKGAFAIGVICMDDPDTLVAARIGSPLIVGMGDGENYIASDAPAILSRTRRVIYLKDEEMAIIRRDSVHVQTFDGKKVTPKIDKVTYSIDAAQKQGYAHFMLKEIHEQADVVSTILDLRIKGKRVVLDGCNMTTKQWQAFNKIKVVACGTAYHAGLVGRYIIEQLARVQVEVDVSSEFRYRDPIVDKKTLVIAVSQSGETADTLAAVREAKKRGATILAICNVIGSSLSRESDGVLYTHAGPEIGVASTKAYTAQLTMFYLLGLQLAQVYKAIAEEAVASIITHLKRVPRYYQEIIKHKNRIAAIARDNAHFGCFLFLGRNINFPTALEGALKLKEISYIPAEGYAAGEMKHGPIALIDEYRAVVCITPESDLYEKMISNIQEIVARKGKVIAVATEGDENIAEHVNHVITIPKTSPLLTPLLTVLPLQLLAYYVAVKRGCDVDQPRNLAKSVTVE